MRRETMRQEREEEEVECRVRPLTCSCVRDNCVTKNVLYESVISIKVGSGYLLHGDVLVLCRDKTKTLHACTIPKELHKGRVTIVFFLVMLLEHG